MNYDEEFDRLCRKIDTDRRKEISQLEDSQIVHKGILSRAVGVLSPEELKKEQEHHQDTEDHINWLKSLLEEREDE